MTSATLIIPARWASSRFEGKPLTADLEGPDGTQAPLIWWTYQAALRAVPTAHVWIATDDARIADTARDFGAQAILTDAACRNGTERVQQAAERLGLRSQDLVVNFQGDAPLTPAHFVTALIEAMASDPDCLVATPALRCDAITLARLRDQRARGLVGGTTLVASKTGRALYFSKEVLPFADHLDPQARTPLPVFHHVGLYAYRKSALDTYVRLAPSPLEQIEGLEQLRFLEHDMALKCVEVDAGDQVFWEVNNPEDVAVVNQALQGLGRDYTSGDLE